MLLNDQHPDVDVSMCTTSSELMPEFYAAGPEWLLVCQLALCLQVRTMLAFFLALQLLST